MRRPKKRGGVWKEGGLVGPGPPRKDPEHWLAILDYLLQGRC